MTRRRVPRRPAVPCPKCASALSLKWPEIGDGEDSDPITMAVFCVACPWRVEALSTFGEVFSGDRSSPERLDAMLNALVAQAVLG